MEKNSVGGKFQWPKIWAVPLAITLAGAIVFAAAFKSAACRGVPEGEASTAEGRGGRFALKRRCPMNSAVGLGRRFPELRDSEIFATAVAQDHPEQHGLGCRIPRPLPRLLWRQLPGNRTTL